MNSILLSTTHYQLTIEIHCSPHLCVGWVLVFGCALPPAPSSRPARRLPTQLNLHTTYSHTQLTHTHTYSHATCPHATYSHTTCPHTTYLHTTCPHTTCSHTACQHTTYSHTTCPHTTYSHTQLVHTQLAHTAAVCVAGLALGDIDLHLAWQAWRVATWIVTGCLRGTLGAWRHRPPLGMAGLELGYIDVHSAWQASHLRRCLRGRHGTWRHGPPLCVTGVVLGDMRGRRGTYGTALAHGGALGWFPVDAVVAAAVCVAGVALGDIDLHLAWQAWHLVTWTCTLRGRRGTYGTGWLWWHAWFPVDAVVAAAVCVAGVACGDIDVHLAWQAWHLATWTCTLPGRRGAYSTGLALVVRLVPGWRRCRRGTRRHRRALCVPGVALGDMDARFAWQAWHSWHWAGSGGALGSQLTPLSLRLFEWTRALCGRRGAYGAGLAVVARLVPS